MAIDEKQYWAAISMIIKMEMTAHEMTQAKLAEAIGIGRVALNNYLAGKREIPFGTFMRIVDVLGVSPQFVFTEAERRMAEAR